MLGWQANKQWSDQYIPAICRIIGPLLLVEAPINVDIHEATDLILLRARDMAIACRVRRPGYADAFPWDFTIRARHDSGAKTEFSKIVEGWGDWMLYGHAGTDSELSRWFLIDLHEFRAELIRESCRSTRKYPDPLRPISNGDGTHFIAYDVRKFPPRVLLASSHKPMNGQQPTEHEPQQDKTFGLTGEAAMEAYRF